MRRSHDRPIYRAAPLTSTPGHPMSVPSERDESSCARQSPFLLSLPSWKFLVGYSSAEPSPTSAIPLQQGISARAAQHAKTASDSPTTHAPLKSSLNFKRQNNRRSENLSTNHSVSIAPRKNSPSRTLRIKKFVQISKDRRRISLDAAAAKRFPKTRVPLCWLQERAPKTEVNHAVHTVLNYHPSNK